METSLVPSLSPHVGESGYTSQYFGAVFWNDGIPILDSTRHVITIVTSPPSYLTMYLSSLRVHVTTCCGGWSQQTWHSPKILQFSCMRGKAGDEKPMEPNPLPDTPLSQLSSTSLISGQNSMRHVVPTAYRAALLSEE